MENTLETDNQNDLPLDKPLSPILCSNKIHRKILTHKRKRNSRVRLTERFTDDVSSNKNEISGQLNDSESVISKAQDDSHQDHCFKKPKLLQTEETHCGFQTATGKSINLSDDKIKHSTKLFDDILNPNVALADRTNKHSVVNRRMSETCLKQKEDVFDTKNINFELNVGFTTASDKSDTASWDNVHKKFSEELSLLKLNKNTEQISLLNTQESNLLFSDNTMLDAKICKEEITSVRQGNSTYGETNKDMEKKDVFVDTIGVKSTNMGFTTASGKSVPISETAWNNVRKKFIEEINLLGTQESNLLSTDITMMEKKNCEGKITSVVQKDTSQSQRKDSFEAENNYGINVGFTTASGTSVTVSKTAWDNVNRKFHDELTQFGFNKNEQEDVNLLNTQETNLFSDFTLLEANASKDESVNLKQESTQKDNSEDTIFAKNSNVGFTTASGKNVTISKTAWDNVQKKFGEELTQFKFTKYKQEEANLLKNQETNSLISDCTMLEAKGIEQENAQALKIDVSENTLCVKNNNFDVNVGFTTASGKSVVISKAAWDNIRKKFSEELTQLMSTKDDGSFIELTEKSPNLRLLQEEQNITSYKSLQKSPIQETPDSTKSMLDEEKIEKIADHNDTDKTLLPASDNNIHNSPSFNETLKPITFQNDGFVSASGTKVAFSKAALDKAQDLDNLAILKRNLRSELINNEDSKNDTSLESIANISQKVSFNNSIDRVINQSISSKKRLKIRPCKQIEISKNKIENAAKLLDVNNSETGSPVRFNLTKIYNSTPVKNVSVFSNDIDVTPIKSNNKTVSVLKEDFVNNDRIRIQGITEGNIDTWNNLLEIEKTNLEMKLKIIMEKQNCLQRQKCILESDVKKQRLNGILFEKKRNNQRTPLQQFIQIDSSQRKRLNITPQNAEFVHFNYTPKTKSVITQDGAVIIPNVNNLIGLTEIELAFKAMDGVDPKLLPKKWIKNHFKWIVWKLASYEDFTKNMNDCLNVENVIQQLKYRYDREIDRAERSALRKIFEKDDAPQKRIVLCVSKIFKIQNGQFELELTDGWYSIRTSIDEPLCSQILKKKVQIGTKLIIYGAELLNCDGCYPLEATDMVRLKINGNSTRRARWYAKLGYQKNSQAFPLQLDSILSNGGLIGCIKILVARVYPVKYMEKQNNLNVWRNKKAEELRAQEYENKIRQDVEKIKEIIRNDCEVSNQNKKPNLNNLSFTNDSIKNINCPEMLYNLHVNCKDPERLEEILTDTQKRSIMDYHQYITRVKEEELARRLQDDVGKLEVAKRDVSSMLQLLVVDALQANKSCIFQIWRPQDVHLETIKESTIFFVYNVLPKNNGVIYSTSKTRFQLCNEELVDSVKYKRTLLPISALNQLENKPQFNEFDTVGLVVSMAINSCTQSLWLADSSMSLLFIRIFASPKNCLLLDKLKVGQTVAVSNLIFTKSMFKFGEAIANHLTIVSCYPQQKHLQEGIEKLNQQFPKDLGSFLEECNQKITYYTDKVDVMQTSINMASKSSLQSASDVFDDNSDALYSSIDVDKFN